MTNEKTNGAKRRAGRVLRANSLKSSIASIALGFSVAYVALPSVAEAQQYRFNSVKIEGCVGCVWFFVGRLTL